jgi:hypothetical protein
VLEVVEAHLTGSGAGAHQVFGKAFYAQIRSMRPLVETNDPVLLSFVESLLGDAGIAASVLDRNMSAIEGSIGVLPRRVLVAEAQLEAARKLLADAGLAEWIVRE